MWFCAPIDAPLPIKGVGFNFMPSWWYRSYGIEYGERMVLDPDYRVETHQTMRRLMAERFGAIHLGDRDPVPCHVAPDWQNAVTSALVGCEVEYPRDNYPIGRHLPVESIDALSVPEDLWSAFPNCEIARQVDYLNRKLATEVGKLLPMRGVLNEAVILRGDAFFMDLHGDPERARKVLDFSAALMSHQLRLNGTGCTLFNCTVPMIGPGTYESQILQLDRQIAQQCIRQNGPFSIHHCGTFDEYAPLYRRLSATVTELDIGHTSDIRLAMDLFPEAAHMSQIVEAGLMNTGTAAAVGERIDQLLEATRGHWERLWLNIADIDYGAPDENLLAVYEHLQSARP